MKTKQTFTIIFFTRKSRSTPSLLAIYARITICSERAEISLKRSIDSREWDNGKGRVKGNSEKARILNAYLDQVYLKLLQCHKELLEEDKIVSSTALKQRFFGEDDESKTLMDLIAYHNESMAHVLKKGTTKNYYTTEKYLSSFLKAKLKTNDVHLKHLNYAFIADFEQYLRKTTNKNKELVLGNNGVMKHLERFKKLVNLAVKLEWIAKNPL